MPRPPLRCPRRDGIAIGQGIVLAADTDPRIDGPWAEIWRAGPRRAQATGAGEVPRIRGRRPPPLCACAGACVCSARSRPEHVSRAGSTRRRQGRRNPASPRAALRAPGCRAYPGRKTARARQGLSFNSLGGRGGRWLRGGGSGHSSGGGNGEGPGEWVAARFRRPLAPLRSDRRGREGGPAALVRWL